MAQYKDELELLHQLGNGHFGTVFAGTHPVYGEVAVKIIGPADAAKHGKSWPVAKAELLVEGQLLEQAAHDCVIRVRGFVESQTGDEVLLIMDLANGGSLQSYYEFRPLRLCEVRSWMTDVALGLGAIHDRGMLHRDLKPANILLDKGRAKVADFGLVTDDLLLGYASMAGYKDHIAPEVWANRQTSKRSDIWAFGMTVYRLLHGADFYSQLVRPRWLVPSGGYGKRLNFLPHIPASWHRFVRRCLNDDPALRPQTASALLNALAVLPIEPDWECTYGQDVVWVRERKARRHTVTLTCHSKLRHEWRFESEPVDGSKPARVVKRSNGAIAPSHAAKDLRDVLL